MNFPTIMLDISLFFGLYFQIFLLVTFFDGEEKEKKIPSLPLSLPTVSIIVPCFNEASTVERTIRSLLGLEYPKDKLSILVVDDGSSDDTYAVAGNLAARLTGDGTFKNIRVVRQENAGKFNAMNYGIRQSTADLVGCLDADSTVDSQALIRMIPLFNDEKVMAVTPAMRAITRGDKPTILQHIQRAEYNIGIFTKKIYGMINAIHVTPGPFSIFRRSVFDTIGYFKHAHNTEDMEIAFRIQSHGYRIANCHDAFVYTITPDTLNKLYRQRTRWTVGFIANLVDYRRILFNKKYGNMGMLTLPFAVIGIVFVFYFVGLTMYHAGTFMYDTYDRIATVGFMSPHFSAAEFFHSLYFNFGASAVLSLILLTTTVYIIFTSKKMAEGSMKPSRDIFYFLFLYSFLAPIWIGKSVYNVVFSRKTPWR